MIISKEIKIKLQLPVTNAQIENTLKEKEGNILRWAITDVDGDLFTIRIAADN